MRPRVVLCAGIVLCLAGTLGAQSTWMAPKRGLWSDPTNWSGDIPSATIKAYFNGPSECTVDIADAAAWQIDHAGGPVKIVDGGVLTVLDWHILGYGEGDVGENAGRMDWRGPRWLGD